MYTHTHIDLRDDYPVQPKVNLVNDFVSVNVQANHHNPLALLFHELDDVIQFADDLRAAALQQFPDEDYSRCDCGEPSDYSSGPYDGMCDRCAADEMRSEHADNQIAYAKENL